MKKSLNKTYFILILLVALNAQSQEKKSYKSILQCLGMEELALHKNKIQGPVYKLNQTLISEVASGNLMQVKREIIENICFAKDFSPSVNFLKNLLIKEKNIYTYDKENVKIYRLQLVATDALQQKVPGLFFQYLISLQGLTNHPDCLYREIPEFDYFMKRFRYLQGDLTPQKLLSDKGKIRVIFEKLKSFSKVLSKCNKS